MLSNTLLSKFIEFDTITIFRHVNPDPDAFGSQLGLKHWLKLNFPNKNVYAVGTQQPKEAFFDLMDEVSDDTISKSLVVVVDTGTSSRIDDERFKLGKYIVKIDHHIETDPFGDLNIVEVECAATCELLAKMFFEQTSYKMNKFIAETLYRGLLTDTLRFSTNNTTPNTLNIASKLSEYEIDISNLNRDMFNKELSEFNFITKLRNKLIFSKNNKIGYVIYNIKDIEESGFTPHEIRGNVAQFGSINELEIWCIFTEKLINNEIYYDGSLRSKSVALNEIASKYNGGGHKNACGVKDLDKNNLQNLINDLNECL